MLAACAEQSGAAQAGEVLLEQMGPGWKAYFLLAQTTRLMPELGGWLRHRCACLKAVASRSLCLRFCFACLYAASQSLSPPAKPSSISRLWKTLYASR